MIDWTYPEDQAPCSPGAVQTLEITISGDQAADVYLAVVYPDRPLACFTAGGFGPANSLGILLSNWKTVTGTYTLKVRHHPVLMLWKPKSAVWSLCP